MEAVLCLPVLLLVSLGVAQFAQIWFFRTMVHYAAYCGARATLVADKDRETIMATEAVKKVCAPLVFHVPNSTDGTGANDFVLPGINANKTIAASDGVNNTDILTVKVDSPVVKFDEIEYPFHTLTTVTAWIPLLVPVAGPIIGKIMKLYNEGSGLSLSADSPGADDPVKLISGDLFPRMKVTEKVYMAKPYLSTSNPND